MHLLNEARAKGSTGSQCIFIIFDREWKLKELFFRASGNATTMLCTHPSRVPIIFFRNEYASHFVFIIYLKMPLGIPVLLEDYGK